MQLKMMSIEIDKKISAFNMYKLSIIYLKPGDKVSLVDTYQLNCLQKHS